MKREHFIFLILIIAAAVITGSTIGLASNFEAIASHLKTPAADVTGLADSEETVEDNELSSENIYTFNDGTILDLNTELNLTEKEKEQIIEMLHILGMVNTSDYQQFLKDFQTNHSLTPTGSLDTKTLNLIIEEVKIKQASRALSSTR